MQKEFLLSWKKKSIISWTVLLEGITKYEGLGNAKTLFDLIPEKNEVTWTIRVIGYVDNGHTYEAFRLLKEMIFAYGFRRNFVTLCSLLRACAQSKEIVMGKWVHVYVLKLIMENEMDVMVRTALVMWNAAVKVFERTRCRNLVMWNAVLSGLAMHGQGTVVLEMFNEMTKELKPDELIFTAVLTACSHSGLIDEGPIAFNDLQYVYGLKPSIQHYACIIDLLGRAGHLEEAESLIK